MLLDLDIAGMNPDNILSHHHHIKGLTTPFRGEVVTLPYGAFHGNVVVTHNETPLVKGTDFVLGHHIPEIKMAHGLTAYLSLVIINPTLTGTLKVTAKFVGDKYVFYGVHNMPEAISIVEAASSALSWNGLIEVPEAFLPGTHDITADEVTYGNQSLAMILWQTLRSKQEASDAAINNVLRLFLKDHQQKQDETINGPEQTVVGSINYLHSVSETLYGINIKLDYKGVQKTNWSVGTGDAGYKLIGADIDVTGKWDTVSSTRPVDAGSVLRFTSTGAVEDITEMAGPYFKAYQTAWALYNRPVELVPFLNAALDATDGRSRKSPLWIESETDLSSFSSVGKVWFHVAKETPVRGYWNGDSSATSPTIPAGRIFSFTPGVGLGELQEGAGNREQSGVLGVVEPELNTEDKSIDGALAELRENLGGQGLSVGDMVMTSRGRSSAPAPGLLELVFVIPPAPDEGPEGPDSGDDLPPDSGGAEYSKVDYADLFAVIGTEYGESLDQTAFKLPSPPGIPPTDYVYPEGPGVTLAAANIRGEDYQGSSSRIHGFTLSGSTGTIWAYNLIDRTRVSVGTFDTDGWTNLKFAGYRGDVGPSMELLAVFGGEKAGRRCVLEADLTNGTLTEKYHFAAADVDLAKDWDLAWDGYFYTGAEMGPGVWMVCDTHVIRMEWSSGDTFVYKSAQSYGSIRHVQFDHRKVMWCSENGIWFHSGDDSSYHELGNFYEADYLMWHRLENMVIGYNSDETKPTVCWVPGNTPDTMKHLRSPAWYNIQNHRVYSLELNVGRFLQELTETPRYQYWIQS